MAAPRRCGKLVLMGQSPKFGLQETQVHRVKVIRAAVGRTRLRAC